MKETNIINREQNNQRRYYFMAGLPRAGSTLLSAILNQNPNIHSGPSSPVTSIMLILEQAISNNELFNAFPKPQQAAELVANVITHYYSDVSAPIVIDKNRSWVNRIHYISGYFGCEPKILVPVRDISEILASFIALHRNSPHEINGKINFIDEMLIKSDISLTDDNRCQYLASSNGILGQSYNGIKQALLNGKEKQLHFIEYNELILSPNETMRKIYDFLEEDYYEHDFTNIKQLFKENDEQIYGFKDMHTVNKALKKSSNDPTKLLSDFILNQCQNLEFWRNLDDY